jgi:outer membrane receptor protein involved in Fe transport
VLWGWVLFSKLVWFSTAVLFAAAPQAWAQAAPPVPAPAAASKPAADTPSTVQGLTVTGQAQAPVRTAIDRRSYSVSGDLQAASGSIGDALRSVPSVEVDVQGNLSLRGDTNVTIMIDGKPSGMFKGSGRAMALQQLPADQIDRVEVITNPSAAFDPDGSAGVINLISKKGRGVGRSGSVRVGLGDFGRRNAGAGFTYNSRKLALNGDLALRHDVQKNAIFDHRTTVDPTTGAAIDSLNTSHGRAVPDIATAHGSLDYDLDETTRLSLALDGNLVEFTAKPLETFEIGPSGGPLVLASQRQGAIHFHNRNSQIDGTYRKTLPGQDHDLTLNLDYDVTTSRSTRPFVYALGPPAPGATFDDYHMRTEFDHTQLKAEYRRPLPGDAKLTAGYQLQHDDNAFDNLDLRGMSQDLATPDPALTDHFRYDQVINSVYGTYQRPIGDLTVLAGLRVEAVRRTTDQLVLGRSDTYDEVRAYPSLHLSYDLGEGRQLTAAYSHRVQRPNPQDLNAYRYYQDAYTYRAGNPLLRPQQTDSYELAYQYKKNGAVYLGTLYYRDNQDAFTDVVRALGGGVLLTTKENLGSSRAAGLELVANGKITPKLTYNISGSVYWTQIDAAGLGFTSERSVTTAQGRANLNWQVTPKDLFQVNLLSNGRRLIPQGYREGWVSMNLGYRHKFDDRVAATVSLQDVFDSFQFHSRVDTPLLKENFDQSVRFRGITVGVTYLFGDTKKAKRDPGFDYGGGGPTP